MPKYDIPLSTVYKDGEGKRVEISTGGSNVSRRFDIIDRAGSGPDDLVGLSESEVEELAHICLAFLNRDRDGTLGLSRTGTSFGDHRGDTEGEDA